MNIESVKDNAKKFLEDLTIHYPQYHPNMLPILEESLSMIGNEIKDILTKPQWEVLMDFLVKGYTFAQIGETRRIAPSNARQHYLTAVKKVALELKKCFMYNLPETS